MAWLRNRKTEVKGINTNSGSYNFAYKRQRTYREEWDPERAMTFAMNRVTWVWRAVDAIAGNAARVPFIVRDHDPETGQIIEDHPLSHLLHGSINPAEDSYAFRYRLSAQVLLSNRGAFVEVIRNRVGEVVGLQLFNPMDVEPEPDPTNFIKYYKIKMPDSKERRIPADRIIWFRKRHPFDPYKCITPLDPAGIAIETDWFARLYNRNFLLNDGRPGGMIVIKGDLEESDVEELRRRHAGGLDSAGRISVITTENGADFVDTAVTPRDAQYEEARKLTKEEILMSFGVPESVLSNASSRTFDNAEQERLIFWQETMVPHLALLAHPFNTLLDDEHSYAGYNIATVDVLQRNETKRREFLLREWEAGLITQNEYRHDTGRSEIPDGGNRIYLPHTKVVVATSDGEWTPPFPTLEDTPSVEGRPRERDYEEFDPDDPDPSQPIDDADRGKSSSPEIVLRVVTDTPEHKEAQTIKLAGHEVSTNDYRQFVDKVRNSAERWEAVAKAAMTRFAERQARVVQERAQGHKARKRLTTEGVDSFVEFVYDVPVWKAQLRDDLTPIISGAMKEVMVELGEVVGETYDYSSEEFVAAVDAQVERALKTIDETAIQLRSAEDPLETISNSLLTIGIDGLTKVAQRESRAALNAGRHLAGELSSALWGKTWVNVGLTELTCSAHKALARQSAPIGGAFTGRGARFAHDPLAPEDFAPNCCCSIVMSGETVALV
jgi:HK97 family phage portal protein